MKPFRVLPSTTSHKHEPLVPTLEVFARLGFFDLDLNLNHIIDGGLPSAAVRAALAANGQRVRIVSGGWCDFFDRTPAIEKTFASVARQVELAREFGVNRMRLFFGRLPADSYSPWAFDVIVANIRRLADTYPDMRFFFENHDGASSRPEVCRAVLEGVARETVRLNFDPINFEHAGVNCAGALPLVAPLVAHVHLKGYADGRFCEFGEGTVDLVPVLRSLIAGGYRGAFTVEYEGIHDRTLRLYQGVRRAAETIASLVEAVRID
jgi:sugar phosphate isomerase/epimerase